MPGIFRVGAFVLITASAASAQYLSISALPNNLNYLTYSLIQGSDDVYTQLDYVPITFTISNSATSGERYEQVLISKPDTPMVVSFNGGANYYTSPTVQVFAESSSPVVGYFYGPNSTQSATANVIDENSPSTIYSSTTITETGYTPETLSGHASTDINGNTTQLDILPNFISQNGMNNIQTMTVTGVSFDNSAWSSDGALNNQTISPSAYYGEYAAGLTFNSAGLLNGTYTANATVDYQFTNMLHPSGLSIAGETTAVFYTTVPLNWTVTGHTGGGSSAVASGHAYSGFGSSSSDGTTSASLVGGSASSDTNVSINFTPSPGGNVLSDEVQLTGTDTDLVALQLSVPLSLLSSEGIDPTTLRLEWDPLDDEEFIPVDGVDTGIIFYANTPFDSSYLVLGDEGEYTDSTNAYVWAVIDHNSDFAVLSVSAPEPMAAAMLLPLAAGWLTRRRNRKSAN